MGVFVIVVVFVSAHVSSSLSSSWSLSSIELFWTEEDSFNFVFYIVGECISCAADTHLATDLTCKKKKNMEDFRDQIAKLCHSIFQIALWSL